MEKNVVDRENNGVDRISQLHEDVLSQILSCLDLKDAVKTSVLSKRWVNVWTLMHCFHLNNQSCLRYYSSSSVLSPKEQMKQNTSFTNFVDRILIGHKNNILPVTSFSLHAYFYRKASSNLSKWIAAAVSPNLENFDLYFSIDPGYWQSIRMPPTLFINCQKLVTLKLGCEYPSSVIRLDNIPTTICLSSLKNLHLSKILFVHENSLTKLLSGCPILEKLCMFEILSTHTIIVCSSSLKILMLNFCYGPYDRNYGIHYVVETPKLEYFDFKPQSLFGITMKAAPSLVEAIVDIHKPKAVLDIFNPSKFVDRDRSMIHELFKAISHVQKLELSTNQIRHSDVISSDYVLPECPLSHLEIIEIQECLRDKDKEMEIKYFLKNGKELKKMIIYSELSLEGQQELLKKYSAVKTSRKCKIEFCSASKLREPTNDKY
ncbi:hypothetical protein REPUB_Repub03eG0028900 [Reevesia pubescens]